MHRAELRWLLDLIDLSEGLPDQYLASRIGENTGDDGSPEAADGSKEVKVTTNSPTTSPSASGHTWPIVFTSDWGVTGVGQAGRTHSTIRAFRG